MSDLMPDLSLMRCNVVPMSVVQLQQLIREVVQVVLRVSVVHGGHH